MLGVVIFRTLKLPPMLGYLVVGVVIGPHALAFAQDSVGVRYLAEFGVVFLMFVIGLEFNLPKLRSMRTLVFGLGMSQVVLTVAGTLVGHLLLVWVWNALSSRPWEMGWQGAMVLGSAMAMSSTAIVAKLLAERMELEAEHGRRIMGVLLFQDLAVVPLLVLIPALGSSGEDLATAMGWALLKAAALLTVLLVGGQRVMRWWLTQVARRKSEELFVLNLLLITLGLAWITEHFGLSLALGAFVAGMLVAETEFKHQVETDIRPFHDVLLAPGGNRHPALPRRAAGPVLHHHRHEAGLAPGARAMVPGAAVHHRAGAGEIRARGGAGAAVRRAAGRGAAHRAVPGAGRRIRLRAADAGRRPRPGGAGVGEPGAGQHGAFDAGHALPHHVQRPDRQPAERHRLDDAVAGADHHRARWTSTPTACARPPRPARAWSSATPPGCKA